MMTLRYGHTRRRGSTLVEFALLLPVLLAILLGIVEFGWLISRTYMVGNATREGARYGALGRTISETKTRVINSASPVTLAESHITLEYLNTATNTWASWPADGGGRNSVPVDSQLRVKVVVPHISLTRFFPILNNRNIIQYTVMRREL